MGGPNQPSSTGEDVLAACGPAEVVFLLGYVNRYLEAEIPNAALRECAKQNPGRVLTFAGIDPTDEKIRDGIKQLRDEGFVGLTLSPACQQVHPCDSRLLGVYETAQELKMPIYFLQGETLPSSAALAYAQPLLLDEMAREFPELKLVISHIGFPWVEQTMALLAKHRHVYADVAGLAGKPWQAYRTLNLAHEYRVIDKLIFGSDYPSFTVKEAVEALYNLNKFTLESVLPVVPREHLRGIVERDSVALLGLRQE
ncbi:MAG: amidohydrolase family protein [Sedimentisphaerales bacterium]|nr:amidohydrolase family protein [Sedimentisphaerales bacterium]